jgi:hypothetical protein
MALANSDPEGLIPALLAFLAAPHGSVESGDEAFNDMALRLFAYQFKHNTGYQRFCQLRGQTPRLVKRWQDIPAVPLNAFKDLTLSCIPHLDCERVFMTSGTTRGNVKGRNFHPSLAVYDASMYRHFAQCFMDGMERIRMGILFPTEAMMPNSSLAHYLALAVANFGAPQSAYFLNEMGLQIESLCTVLAEVQTSGEPIALLGASYAFVHLFDALDARGLKFKLPAGSRILDTGGFKGQSREVPMDAFYGQLSSTFGVARRQCINMYGMTELSTQFYDAGNETVPSEKCGPHWIRSRVVDPLTGLDVPLGERGILVHTDLANFNSATTILTEDVGVATLNGFLLLGRAQGVEAKGCSMAVDEFLRSAAV